MMKNIAYMGIDIQFARLNALDAKRGLVFLYEYDLPYTDLMAFDGVIISNHVDEAFLVEHNAVLTDYLAKGGVIFTLAEKGLPWLTEVANWKRSPIPLKDREARIIATDHTLFEGVTSYDIEYRKGVRGFFSRGYFETVPAHAKKLVVDQQDNVIVYVDRESTNGTIYAGAGTDMYSNYIHEDNSSSEVSLQMLEAIHTEAARNRGDN